MKRTVIQQLTLDVAGSAVGRNALLNCGVSVYGGSFGGVRYHCGCGRFKYYCGSMRRTAVGLSGLSVTYIQLQVSQAILWVSQSPCGCTDFYYRCAE